MSRPVSRTTSGQIAGGAYSRPVSPPRSQTLGNRRESAALGASSEIHAANTGSAGFGQSGTLARPFATPSRQTPNDLQGQGGLVPTPHYAAEVNDAGRLSAVPSHKSQLAHSTTNLVPISSGGTYAPAVTNGAGSQSASTSHYGRASSVQGAARAMTPINAAPSHIQLQQRYKAFQMSDGDHHSQAALSASPSVGSMGRHAAAVPGQASSSSASNPHNSHSQPTANTVSSARGGSGSAGRPVKLLASRKVKVIDYLRRSLLPVHHRGAITRDDMVVVCSTICKDFMDQSPYSAEEMAETSSVPLGRDDESLLSTLLLTTLKDLNSIKTRGSAAATPALVEPIKGQSAKVTPMPSVSLRERRHSGALPSAGYSQQPTPSQGGITFVGPTPSFSGRGLADSGLHAVLSSQSAPRSAVSASQKTAPSLFQSVSYTISGAYPRGATNAASAYRGGQGAGDTVSPYHQAVLKTSITSPSVQDADGDIVVIGNVSTSFPVALTWWLGYGPQRTILNLDKLYTNGQVATYQITDSSFILTFKRGALVAGWDYSVYLRITSSDGTTVSASTTFVIPSLSNDVDPSTITSLEDAQQRGAALRRGIAPNPYSGRTQEGYYGDGDINDDEHMSRAARFGPQSGYGNTPPPAGGTPTNARSYDPAPQPLSRVAGEPVSYDVYQGSAAIAPRYSEVVHGKVRDAMGGTSLYYDQRDYGIQQQRQRDWEEQHQQHQPQAAASGSGDMLSINSNTNAELGYHNPNPLAKLGVRGQINPYFVAPVPAMGATYQEQLRHFFVDHIEPLYYISPNPAMPEEAFKAIVKDIAKRYWFAYDKSQQLTDALKREIIDTIKARISNAMLLPPQQREAMFEREKARADEEERQRRLDDQASRQHLQQVSAARQQQQQLLAAEWGPSETSGGAYYQQPPSGGAYFGITGAQ